MLIAFSTHEGKKYTIIKHDLMGVEEKSIQNLVIHCHVGFSVPNVSVRLSVLSVRLSTTIWQIYQAPV